jgi:hypothetical protein
MKEIVMFVPDVATAATVKATVKILKNLLDGSGLGVDIDTSPQYDGAALGIVVSKSCARIRAEEMDRKKVKGLQDSVELNRVIVQHAIEHPSILSSEKPKISAQEGRLCTEDFRSPRLAANAISKAANKSLIEFGVRLIVEPDWSSPTPQLVFTAVQEKPVDPIPPISSSNAPGGLRPPPDPQA